MKDFSGFQKKTNGEARRLPFFLAASFATGMVYTDESGVKAFLNGATGIIAWDPGSSGKDEGDALALLVACSQIQFFRANPAYENPPVYPEGSEGSKDDLPEWAGDMKPGWEYEQFHTGAVWANKKFSTGLHSGCIGTFPLHSKWETHVWRLSEAGKVESFESPSAGSKYAEYGPADESVPEWIGKIMAGFYGAQNADGEVWESVMLPKGYSAGYWVIDKPDFVGIEDVHPEHATAYWTQTADGKIVKIKVSAATGEAPKRAE